MGGDPLKSVLQVHLCAWRGQNARKRVRKMGKVMQTDFAEEGLIGFSYAAKGGDPEKAEG